MFSAGADKEFPNMRGDIILKVLESVEDASLHFIDVFNAFLKAGYGASFWKMERELEKIKSERDKRQFDRETAARLRQRYDVLIYKLKKDGLVKEGTGRGEKTLSITRGGKLKLNDLRAKAERTLPTNYKKEPGSALVIFAFDVPEKEKRKREWLRAVLRGLGFTMIQKSVWVGRKKIPREFLEDINKFKMVDFVEIFEVSKTGSLKHVI
mgnify:CR=1 FL=1